MADLSLKRWARYEPGIPGNAELKPEERFYLEVQAGLSTVEVRSLFEQMPQTENAEARAELLAKAVRLGRVPLRLDGADVSTLTDYCRAIESDRGQLLVTELLDMVLRANTYDGVREFFSARPSGGSASTPAPSGAPAGSQTAVP